MQQPLRIGTRDSLLAMWQAKKVQALLAAHDITSEIVPTKSEGDLDLVTPLYAMGVQGVFTKTLDSYLLSNKIDIAVHSMKDVPIQLPQGISEAAVLERASFHDVLVPKVEYKIDLTAIADIPAIIGTGSIRRKAQWLYKFPNHQLVDLRGNLQTRLSKLADSNWQGAIFASAGLERLNILPKNAINLDWMLPAPAQGAIMVVARSADTQILECLKKINHEPSAQAVHAERDFLAALMGGCSTPIAAHATVDQNNIFFKGRVTAIDGKQQFTIKLNAPLHGNNEIGKDAAMQLLEQHHDAIKAIVAQKIN